MGRVPATMGAGVPPVSRCGCDPATMLADAHPHGPLTLGPLGAHTYELTLHPLPGHTLHAVAIEATIDGLRLIAEGDAPSDEDTVARGLDESKQYIAEAIDLQNELVGKIEKPEAGAPSSMIRSPGS